MAVIESVLDSVRHIRAVLGDARRALAGSTAQRLADPHAHRPAGAGSMAGQSLMTARPTRWASISMALPSATSVAGVTFEVLAPSSGWEQGRHCAGSGPLVHCLGCRVASATEGGRHRVDARGLARKPCTQRRFTD